MSQTDALRASFSDLSTATLRDLWATEARAEWAESILREELLARDVSRAELDDVAARREEIAKNVPPSARDTLWKFGVVGRMAALVSTGIAFGLFDSLFGKRVGAYAMAAVFAVYVTILIRRVFFQSKFRISGGATFAMIWQSGEAVLILCGLFVLAATLQ
jgi:hypothetical protein